MTEPTPIDEELRNTFPGTYEVCGFGFDGPGRWVCEREPGHDGPHEPRDR